MNERFRRMIVQAALPSLALVAGVAWFVMKDDAARSPAQVAVNDPRPPRPVVQTNQVEGKRPKNDAERVGSGQNRPPRIERVRPDHERLPRRPDRPRVAKKAKPVPQG